MINQYMRIAPSTFQVVYIYIWECITNSIFTQEVQRPNLLFGSRKLFAYMNHPKDHSWFILELLRYGYNSTWFKSQQNWTYKNNNIFNQFGTTCGGIHTSPTCGWIDDTPRSNDVGFQKWIHESRHGRAPWSWGIGFPVTVSQKWSLLVFGNEILHVKEWHWWKYDEI